jgi:penicillin-binding protein activator
MVKIIGKLLVGLLVLSTLGACGTSVERVATNTVTDLSGDFNDTDSRLVASEMVADKLSHPWLARFDGVPVVIVGKVKNLTVEHINIKTFINDIRRELINSGRVDFVASSTDRGEIRQERLEQDGHASEATRKAAGEEIGADFILGGTISTISDVADGVQVKYYQFDLTLTNIASNRIAWLGQKKIKKIISKPSLRF